MYAYMDCELKAPQISPTPDNYITSLKSRWNIIGNPDDEPIDIEDLIIYHNGVDYTWSEATDPINGPIIVPSVYSWDRTNQIYTVATSLDPGRSYWVYSYYDCIIKK
jgi:hypothetical protein